MSTTVQTKTNEKEKVKVDVKNSNPIAETSNIGSFQDLGIF